MTEKVEDIHERLDRLEKRFAEFEKRNIDSVPVKKDEQVQKSCNRQSIVSFFQGLSICILGGIVMIHLMVFLTFSYEMLEPKFKSYFLFLQENTYRFYQLFG